jgi:hypothetical protein
MASDLRVWAGRTSADQVPIYLNREDMNVLAVRLRNAIGTGALAGFGLGTGHAGAGRSPERVARIILADIDHLNRRTESGTDRDDLAAWRWQLAKDVLRLLKIAGARHGSRR